MALNALSGAGSYSSVPSSPSCPSAWHRSMGKGHSPMNLPPGVAAERAVEKMKMKSCLHSRACILIG